MTATPHAPRTPDLEAPSTGRLQLALNVDDLDAAIDFYTRMFGVGPVKVKPGYANFADRVAAAQARPVQRGGGAGHDQPPRRGGRDRRRGRAPPRHRLRADGLETTDVVETACCFAVKTETWLEAPDGQRWEWYVKRGDLAGFASGERDANPDPRCCG